MKNIHNVLFFCIVCFSCQSQKAILQLDCNRDTWAKWIRKKLPNSICVEQDKMVYNLYDDFDYNSDAMKDVAIEIGRKKLSTDNINTLVFYKQLKDSTFVKYKELNNIYPTWFSNYSLSAEEKDTKFNVTKELYGGNNPLIGLELKQDLIILNLIGDAVTEYYLTFKYSLDNHDWFLIKYKELDKTSNIRLPYTNTNKLNTSITKFNYKDFFYGLY